MKIRQAARTMMKAITAAVIAILKVTIRYSSAGDLSRRQALARLVDCGGLGVANAHLVTGRVSRAGTCSLLSSRGTLARLQREHQSLRRYSAAAPSADPNGENNRGASVRPFPAPGAKSVWGDHFSGALIGVNLCGSGDPSAGGTLDLHGRLFAEQIDPDQSIRPWLPF